MKLYSCALVPFALFALIAALAGLTAGYEEAGPALLGALVMLAVPLFGAWLESRERRKQDATLMDAYLKKIEAGLL